MDAKTGYIYPNSNESDARNRGALVPIPKDDEERVINMNRRQRRAWAAQQRRAKKG